MGGQGLGGTHQEVLKEYSGVNDRPILPGIGCYSFVKILVDTYRKKTEILSFRRVHEEASGELGDLLRWI